MLIGFLDDTEIVVDPDDPQPDIFVFGGYFIRQELLHAFQQRICETKFSHGFIWHAPVKWNLRDTSLREFYKTERLLNPENPDELLTKSFAIRRDLLSLLKEFDAQIFISARYDISRKEANRSQYYQWAFENLLQRVGLMAKLKNTKECQSSSVSLVVDWPQSGIDKRLFDVYMGGYYFGRGFDSHQNYFSGDLRQYQFADSIYHASTLHSGPLQIADLVVGCCRDFLSWAYKGTNLHKIAGLFDLLMHNFYVDENGRLDGCGFKIAKGTPLDIEAKINAYCDAIHLLQQDDIAF